MISGIVLFALIIWFGGVYDDYQMYRDTKSFLLVVAVAFLLSGVLGSTIYATNHLVNIHPEETHVLIPFSDGNCIHFTEVNGIRNFAMNLDNGKIVTLPSNYLPTNTEVKWSPQNGKPTLGIVKRSPSMASVLFGFTWREKTIYKIYYSEDISSL